VSTSSKPFPAKWLCPSPSPHPSDAAGAFHHHCRPPDLPRRLGTPPPTTATAPSPSTHRFGEPPSTRPSPAGNLPRGGAHRADLVARYPPASPSQPCHRGGRGRGDRALRVTPAPSGQTGQAKIAANCARPRAQFNPNTVHRVFRFFYFNLNFKNSYKLLKYVENIIRLIKIQTKFL
jgi:hypothetical protein